MDEERARQRKHQPPDAHAHERPADRLGRSDTFLRLAGKSLGLGFALRRGVTDSAEAWLHAWRAPSLGDIQAMRTQLRQLGDRLEVTQTQLELALAALRGQRLQVPPMYSALKRDGRPLYELADLMGDAG